MSCYNDLLSGARFTFPRHKGLSVSADKKTVSMPEASPRFSLDNVNKVRVSHILRAILPIVRPSFPRKRLRFRGNDGAMAYARAKEKRGETPAWVPAFFRKT